MKKKLVVLVALMAMILSLVGCQKKDPALQWSYIGLTADGDAIRIDFDAPDKDYELVEEEGQIFIVNGNDEIVLFGGFVDREEYEKLLRECNFLMVTVDNDTDFYDCERNDELQEISFMRTAPGSLSALIMFNNDIKDLDFCTSIFERIKLTALDPEAYKQYLIDTGKNTVIDFEDEYDHEHEHEHEGEDDHDHEDANTLNGATDETNAPADATVAEPLEQQTDNTGETAPDNGESETQP